MTLSFEMESMEGVASDIAALYSEQDGKFYLTGISGVSPKTKVDEFRDSNIELNNRLKAFEGIDPKAHKAMNTELEDLRAKLEKSKVDDEQIDKIVANRTKQLQEEFAGKEVEFQQTIDTQGRQLESLIIDGQVKSAAVQHKIKDSALEDVVLRAKSVYKVVEGKAVGYKDGEIIYDATGNNPLPIGDWVKGLVNTADHLFQESVTSEIFKNRPGYKGDANSLNPTQKIQAGLS